MTIGESWNEDYSLYGKLCLWLSSLFYSLLLLWFIHEQDSQILITPSPGAKSRYLTGLHIMHNPSVSLWITAKFLFIQIGVHQTNNAHYLCTCMSVCSLRISRIVQPNYTSSLTPGTFICPALSISIVYFKHIWRSNCPCRLYKWYASP